MNPDHNINRIHQQNTPYNSAVANFPFGYTSPPLSFKRSPGTRLNGMKPNIDSEPLGQRKPSLGHGRVSPILEGTFELRRPPTILGHARPRHLSGIREVSKESHASGVEKPRSIRSLFPQKSAESKSIRGEQSGETIVPHNDVPYYDGPPPPVPVHAQHTHSSTVSLPITSLPERRSSRRLNRRHSEAFVSSEDYPSLGPPPAKGLGRTTPSRGLSASPVRATSQRDALSADAMRRMPSRTFVRSIKPTDILETPNATQPRIDMDLGVAAPLFVGGGTIEGHIHMTIDSSLTTVRKKIKRIMIARVCVDIVGVEEMSDGRRWIFLSLANELIDERHPPPMSLINDPTVVSPAEPFWIMKSGSGDIPFRLNLPLNMGPPPYSSKHARIRYVICSTALIKVNGKQNIVRRSQDITVVTVFDPERALASLPSPLIASDEMQLPGVLQTHSVKLTAGIHRQTWVDGANIFVDVHVLNNSAKLIKKLEIQLEKMTLFFAHAAAGTSEKSVQHLRLPSRKENELVARVIVKKDKFWKGVAPNSSEVRTCELEIPKGHVTISTGRYFEVRYFLNISITVSMFKMLPVQLPVTLIHMNSLDVVPNSLAQVAAAIADKRSRSVTHWYSSVEPPIPYSQGQAFTAPRTQSISQDFRPTVMEQIDDLTRELDDSPRKMMRVSTEGDRPTASNRRGNGGLHVDGGEQFYHNPRCHRRHTSSASSVPRLPRIQLSTSGLGFSDTDFEISPARRKKVLNDENVAVGFTRSRRGLSEKERREIKIRQELSSARKRSREGQVPWGWRNVAVERVGRPSAPRDKGKARAIWVDQ